MTLRGPNDRSVGLLANMQPEQQTRQHNLADGEHGYDQQDIESREPQEALAHDGW